MTTLIYISTIFHVAVRERALYASLKVRTFSCTINQGNLGTSIPMPQRPFQRPIIHTPHKCCDILSFFTRIHPWVYTTLTQVQAQTVWIEELINNKIPWLGLGRSNSRKIFLYSRKSLQSPETIKHTHPNKNIDVIPNNSFQPGHEH